VVAVAAGWWCLVSSLRTITEVMAAHPVPEAVTATGAPEQTAEQTATPPATSTALDWHTAVYDAPGDACDFDAIKAEAPLLERIRSDTGEAGHGSGGRIDFTVCPVCGHRDCFSFYIDTNSWTCFGASNATGITGGSYVDYLRATTGASVSEAVAQMRKATGHPLPPKSTAPAGEGKDGESKAPRLPMWEPVRASDPPKRNPPLIGGVLRRGHVSLLAGKGKAGKSWAAIRLACDVATGGTWFGWPCGQGRVLYIDPEIHSPSLDNRFHAVCEAGGYDASTIDAAVLKWSLRGVRGATIGAVANALAGGFKSGELALIIIDSASCFLAGDENAAVEVRRFSASVLDIARHTGAAVLLVHHFGKGPAGDRDAGDRARGSSVWLDFPDAVLTVTEIFPPSGEQADHLGDGARAFVLDCPGVREFAAPEPRHVIFKYPLHRLDTDGISIDWKPSSSASRGGKAASETNKAKGRERADSCMLALASEFIRRGDACDGIPAGEAADVCSEALGHSVNPQTLKKYVEASALFDVEQLRANRWQVVRSDHGN